MGHGSRVLPLGELSISVRTGRLCLTHLVQADLFYHIRAWLLVLEREQEYWYLDRIDLNSSLGKYLDHYSVLFGVA